MKKFFSLFLAIALAILPLMPIATASDTPSILHYSVTNATGSAKNTAVSTSTIIPGKHRILGFRVCPVTSGSGTNVGGLYDAASTSDLSSANLLGEDSSANTASAGYDFPAPIPLSNGLYVAQGAQTTVTIYYERTIP
jgi:hypothetical protein